MTVMTLRKLGGSTAVVIPPPLLKKLELHAGQRVSIEAEADRLVIQAERVRSYLLADLLAACDFSVLPSDEDAAWLADGPAGQELV